MGKPPLAGGLASLVLLITEAPWRLGPAARARAQAAGLSDESLVQVVLVSAFFGHLNRVADAVAIELDFPTFAQPPHAEPATPPYLRAPAAGRPAASERSSPTPSPRAWVTPPPSRPFPAPPARPPWSPPRTRSPWPPGAWARAPWPGCRRLLDFAFRSSCDWARASLQATAGRPRANPARPRAPAGSWDSGSWTRRLPARNSRGLLRWWRAAVSALCLQHDGAHARAKR